MAKEKLDASNLSSIEQQSNARDNILKALIAYNNAQQQKMTRKSIQQQQLQQQQQQQKQLQQQQQQQQMLFGARKQPTTLVASNTALNAALTSQTMLKEIVLKIGHNDMKKQKMRQLESQMWTKFVGDCDRSLEDTSSHVARLCEKFKIELL